MFLTIINSRYLERIVWCMIETGDTKWNRLVGYADDEAVLVTARNLDLVQLKMNQVMWRVRRMDEGLHADFGRLQNINRVSHHGAY